MTKSLFSALLLLTGNTLLALATPPASAATLTYSDPTCTGFSVTGSGGTFTLTCAKDVTGTAPVCTPSGVTTPNPITSAGGTIALNANCVPSSGVTYSWTRTAPTAGQPTDAMTVTPSDTLAANTGASGITYTWLVVGCNGTACDSAKSVTVVVPAPGGGGGGGGGGGAVSCAGYASTILIDIPWGTPYTRYTTSGFGNNTALVIRMGAPVGTPIAPNYGSIAAYEYASPKTTRTAVISTNACDFTNTIGSLYYRETGASWDWSTLLVSAQQFLYHEVRMAPGTTYYINVRNTNSLGTSTCSVSACDMAIDWNPPH